MLSHQPTPTEISRASFLSVKNHPANVHMQEKHVLIQDIKATEESVLQKLQGEATFKNKKLLMFLHG